MRSRSPQVHKEVTESIYNSVLEVLQGVIDPATAATTSRLLTKKWVCFLNCITVKVSKIKSKKSLKTKGVVYPYEQRK